MPTPKAKSSVPPEIGEPAAAAAPNISQSGPHGRNVLSHPSAPERRRVTINDRSLDFSGMRRSSPVAMASRASRKNHGAMRAGPVSRRWRKPRPMEPQSVPASVYERMRDAWYVAGRAWTAHARGPHISAQWTPVPIPASNAAEAVSACIGWGIEGNDGWCVLIADFYCDDGCNNQRHPTTDNE